VSPPARRATTPRRRKGSPPAHTHATGRGNDANLCLRGIDGATKCLQSIHRPRLRRFALCKPLNDTDSTARGHEATTLHGAARHGTARHAELHTHDTERHEVT
jgi:hypothetical protein